MTAVSEPPPGKPAAKKKPDAATQRRLEWPYKFEILPLTELTIDEAYQRPLTSFWMEVRDKFDPALVGTLIISRRKSGVQAVIDGQTRKTAMEARGIDGAPCLVYERLTQAQEADLFAALQRQRRSMRLYHRFRAELVAKKEQAVGISKVVTAAGFDLGVEETKNTLQSITALEKAYRVDPDHLADTLGIIRDVWGTEDKDAVSAQIINGISTFIRKQERLDYDRLRDRLRDVTPRLLMNRASQIREGAGSGTGAAGAISQAILNEYMRRKR